MSEPENRLRKLFDDKPPEVTPDSLPPAKKGKPIAVSPYVMKHDSWGKRRGKDLKEDEHLKDLKNLSDHDLADLHAVCWDPEPSFETHTSNRPLAQFIQQLLETPDFRSLHVSSQLCVETSYIIAVNLARRWDKVQEKREKRQRRGDCDGEGEKESGDKGKEPDEEMENFKEIAGALKEAEKDLDTMEGMKSAFGLGPGGPGSEMSPEQLLDLFEKCRSSESLTRILELAGRYRRLARSLQAQKSSHGCDEMVGIIPDNNLSRLLPQESILLGIPQLRPLFLRRWSERQLLCREMSSPETEARGPIVIVLDESGSMQSISAESKALALAMAWIAQAQKRWCALVAWSGNTGERLLPLSPGKWNPAELYAWLLPFLSGGSNMDLPIPEIRDLWKRLGAPAGKTDLIFVSDCKLYLNNTMVQSFQAWKQESQARVFTFHWNAHTPDPQIQEISDAYYQVSSLDLDSEGIKDVLSI